MTLRVRRAGRATAAIVLGLLGLAAASGAGRAGAAEIRRMEAVGAVGLVPGEQPRVAPRDAAVRAALQDAVRRVALDLEGRDAEPPATEPDDSLAGALGPDPLKYTTRFRILEDRGERPALLVDTPNVESEYVIVVEAHVDVDRVRQSLIAAGLLAVPSGETLRVRLLVVVELADGARGYGAYAALRKALLDIRGVRSALPREIQRGRATLAVEADREARALLDDLLRSGPPGLRITPLSAEPGGLTLRVEEMAAAPLPGAIDTGTPKRY